MCINVGVSVGFITGQVSIPPPTEFGNCCVQSICRVSNNISNLSFGIEGVVETFDLKRSIGFITCLKNSQSNTAFQFLMCAAIALSNFKCFGVYRS